MSINLKTVGQWRLTPVQRYDQKGETVLPTNTLFLAVWLPLDLSTSVMSVKIRSFIWSVFAHI